MQEKCVHTEHCCAKHGCKYSEDDCPVYMGVKKQSFPCMECSSENEAANTLSLTKALDYYADLTNGGKYEVTLNQQEACIALKIHDRGVETLNEIEKQALYSLIGKLKDQIWP